MGYTTGPRKKEAVYNWERYQDGEQPNGQIVHIEWSEQEVVVEYYNDNKTQVSYSFEDLEWCSKFRGRWLIGCETTERNTPAA